MFVIGLVDKISQFFFNFNIKILQFRTVFSQVLLHFKKCSESLALTTSSGFSRSLSIRFQQEENKKMKSVFNERN